MSDGETARLRSFILATAASSADTPVEQSQSAEDFLLNRSEANASLLLSEIAPSSFSKEVHPISGPDPQLPGKPLPTL